MKYEDWCNLEGRCADLEKEVAQLRRNVQAGNEPDTRMATLRVQLTLDAVLRILERSDFN